MSEEESKSRFKRFLTWIISKPPSFPLPFPPVLGIFKIPFQLLWAIIIILIRIGIVLAIPYFLVWLSLYGFKTIYVDDRSNVTEEEAERTKVIKTVFFLVIYFAVTIALIHKQYKKKNIGGKKQIVDIFKLLLPIILLLPLYLSDKYLGTYVYETINNNGYVATFYYLIIVYILIKTVLRPFAFLMRGSIIQAKDDFKVAYKSNNKKATNVVINYLAYYFLILVIIHVLWIILVYTSPTINKGIKLSDDKKCDKNWLYYGKYPQVSYSPMEDINKYMFDLRKWWPSSLEDNPDFTCQPCPTNLTPVIRGDTNTTCRPCNNTEEWYSINEIIDKHKEGRTLSSNQREAIGNDGITVPSPFFIDNIDDISIKHFYEDHSKEDGEFENMLNNTGMCLPHPTMGSSEFNSIDCNGYSDCMGKATHFIELSWDKDVSHHHRVFPGQRFEIRDLTLPLSFDVPSFLYNPGNPIGTDNPVYLVNNAHPSPNKYNNPICDIKSEPVAGGINKCYLRIPLTAHPTHIINSGIPIKDRVIRHGSNSSMSGPPCDSINQIGQDYLIGNTEISYVNINDNKLDDNKLDDTNTFSRIVTAPSTDWRNVYDTIYNTCYDTQGQCFMDHAICKTKNDTPLPLVHRFSDNSPSPRLTIPTASLLGCENISIPCGPSPVGSDCNALSVDGNYNIIDVPGTCKYVKWENDKWNLGRDYSCSNNDDTDCVHSKRCIPNQKIPDSPSAIENMISSNRVTYDNEIFDNHNSFENMCKRVPRFPEAVTNPTNYFTYNIYQNIYRHVHNSDDDNSIVDDTSSSGQTTNIIREIIVGDKSKVNRDMYTTTDPGDDATPSPDPDENGYDVTKN